MHAFSSTTSRGYGRDFACPASHSSLLGRRDRRHEAAISTKAKRKHFSPSSSVSIIPSSSKHLSLVNLASIASSTCFWQSSSFFQVVYSRNFDPRATYNLKSNTLNHRVQRRPKSKHLNFPCSIPTEDRDKGQTAWRRRPIQLVLYIYT